MPRYAPERSSCSRVLTTSMGCRQHASMTPPRDPAAAFTYGGTGGRPPPPPPPRRSSAGDAAPGAGGGGGDEEGEAAAIREAARAAAAALPGEAGAGGKRVGLSQFHGMSARRIRKSNGGGYMGIVLQAGGRAACVSVMRRRRDMGPTWQSKIAERGGGSPGPLSRPTLQVVQPELSTLGNL
jgi:hypothetical protein